MLQSWGKKIMEKVDELIDQVQENLTKKKNKLQPLPVKVKNSRIF